MNRTLRLGLTLGVLAALTACSAPETGVEIDALKAEVAETVGERVHREVRRLRESKEPVALTLNSLEVMDVERRSEDQRYVRVRAQLTLDENVPYVTDSVYDPINIDRLAVVGERKAGTPVTWEAVVQVYKGKDGWQTVQAADRGFTPPFTGLSGIEDPVEQGSQAHQVALDNAESMQRAVEGAFWAHVEKLGLDLDPESYVITGGRALDWESVRAMRVRNGTRVWTYALAYRSADPVTATEISRGRRSATLYIDSAPQPGEGEQRLQFVGLPLPDGTWSITKMRLASPLHLPQAQVMAYAKAHDFKTHDGPPPRR